MFCGTFSEAFGGVGVGVDMIKNKPCYFFEVISGSVTLLSNNLLYVAPELIDR
jgi:hypothetical protein